MTTSNPHKLCFGVEIECAARVFSDVMDDLVQRYDRHGLRDNRQVLIYHLSEKLKEAGIPSYGLKRKNKTYSKWAFDEDSSISA